MMITEARTRPNWSTPDARQILTADAPREAWLKARTNGLGGTDVATLRGVNPYRGPFRLWLDKTGCGDDFTGSDAAQRGTWLEPHLADWFHDQTDIAVRRVGLLASRTQDHRLASIDRLTSDGGILEIKTHDRMATVAKQWADGGVGDSALVQAQWYLAVTGRSHAWFVVMIGDTPSLRGPIPRDEDLIKVLEVAADLFWIDHVEPGVAPPVDMFTITEDEVAARWPNIEPEAITDITGPDGFGLEMDLADFLHADAEAKRHKAIADACKTRIKAFAAGREFLALDGRQVARIQSITSRRLDSALLKAEHPEITDVYTRASISQRVTIKETS